MADEGVRLTDCYSAAPICSPSRAGLLTGRCPTRAGIYSWISEKNPMQLKRDETTIATLLKGAGYDTCHSGKWHLNGWFNDPRHAQPGDHGFDHWFSTQNNAAPSHENPRNFVRNGERVGPLEGYSCQIVAGEAISWLKGRQNHENPFFLFVCFHEPHEPVASPPELVAHYPEATERGEAEYYANVENVDIAVGRLLAAVDEIGARESTLVFFTSDNGPETLNRYPNAWRSHGSPGPLRGMKLHVYEGGIRVPGILRWPGQIEAGAVRSDPVSSVDLLPTFCELAGVALPTGKPLDGTSLVDFLHGGHIGRTKPLFWHYMGGIGNRQFSARDGEGKIVATWDGPSDMPAGSSLRPGDVELLRASNLQDFELYRIGSDIMEQHDLADDKPTALRELRAFASKTYREIIGEGPDWAFEEK